MTKYDCPVCGYPALPDPPRDFEICPSCGTEFDYHDATKTHKELRDAWIAAGLRWSSRAIPQPTNWNPFDQLFRAGLGYRFMDESSDAVIPMVIEHFTLTGRPWLPNDRLVIPGTPVENIRQVA
jgi:hypothetical protein